MTDHSALLIGPRNGVATYEISRCVKRHLLFIGDINIRISQLNTRHYCLGEMSNSSFRLKDCAFLQTNHMVSSIESIDEAYVELLADLVKIRAS